MGLLALLPGSRKRPRAIRTVFVAAEEEAATKPRYREYVYRLLRRPPPVWADRTTSEIEKQISQENPYNRSEINSLRNQYPDKFWGGKSDYWDEMFVEDRPPDEVSAACSNILYLIFNILYLYLASCTYI